MNNSAIDKIEPAKNMASAMTPDPPDAGDISHVRGLLKGRYSVLRMLASGEDGSHYLARAAEQNSLLNLKVLYGQAARESRKVELFRLEADAAARLSQEYIVTASPVQQVNSAYLTASRYNPELVTLRDLLDRNSVFGVRQAVEIARKITVALDHAHRLGVLHLQLNPQNVLLGDDKTVLVAGFGIDARDELEWVHKKRSYGCPVQYRSPEQMIGARVGHRSDLYCLGILLFEMLTDRVPFNSSDPEYIKRKRTTQTPWPPHALRENIPEPLSNLVLELLKCDPDERIQSAAEFLSAMDDLIISGQAEDVMLPVPTPQETQRDDDGQSLASTGFVIVDPDGADPSAYSVLLPESHTLQAGTEDAGREDMQFDGVAIENAEDPPTSQAGVYELSGEPDGKAVLSETGTVFLAAFAQKKPVSSRRLAFIVAALVCIAALTVFTVRGRLNTTTKPSKEVVSAGENADQPASALDESAAPPSPSTPEPAGVRDNSRQTRKKMEVKTGTARAEPTTPEGEAETPGATTPSSTLMVVPLTGNKSGAITVNTNKNNSAIVVSGSKPGNETRKATDKMGTTNRGTTVSNADGKRLPIRKQKENGSPDPR